MVIEAAARLTTGTESLDQACRSLRNRKLLGVRLTKSNGERAGVAINLELTPEEARLELPPGEWSTPAVLSKKSGEWLLEGITVVL